VLSLERSLRSLNDKYGAGKVEESQPTDSPCVNNQGDTKQTIDNRGQRIILEVARMTSYEDEGGRFIESLLETEKPKAQDEKRKKTYAIEITRRVRVLLTNGRYSYSPVPGGLLTMTINSLELIDALRKVASYHPAGLLERDTFQIQEPFDFVVQHMAGLEEHVAKSEENGNLASHFKLLKTFIQEKYGEDIEAEKHLHAQTPPRCSFKMLWLLFEKGEDVVAKSGGEHCAFVVSDSTDPKRQERGKQGAFMVHCWYMDFDGKEFGRVQQPEESSFTIFSFQGSKEITSLPIYPIKYHNTKPNEPPLRDYLIERGKKFWKLRSATQRMYKGETLDYGKRYIDSRVMVDYQTYTRINPDSIVLGELEIEDKVTVSKPINGCNCIECLESKEDGSRSRSSIFEKYDHISVESESLTDHQLMLLTNRVPGFYLQDRKWGTLSSPF
jgi:hypothetical protein